MKILMVTNMLPTEDRPSYGIFVRTQIDSIAAAGHSVDIQFIPGYKSRLEYVWAVKTLYDRLRRSRYDLVHAHYGLAGIVACMQSRIPVLTSFCGDDLLGTPSTDRTLTTSSRLVMALSQMAASWSDAIIVKSQQMKACLWSGAASRKAHVIPNGVNFDVFKPRDVNAVRQQLGLDLNRKYILFPSTPYELRKRIDLARSAMHLLKKEIPELELLVIYHRPQEEIALYMSACDVMVLTSDWEGSPNVVKEAMASNLPVVTVDAGDAWDVIRGVRACYRAERSETDIAKQTARALSAGERSDGRDHIAYLEVSEIAGRVIEIYQGLKKAPTFCAA